jgi:hypothetical protein
MPGPTGVTTTDAKLGVLTVTARGGLVTLSFAVMFVVPGVSGVTRPVLLTVATAVFDEVQVATEVKFWVPPLLKVPVAVSCWVDPPAAIAGAGLGVRAMEVGVGDPPPEF